MTTLSYSRNGKTYEAEVESLPPASIEYLLRYGFAQSLQDCIAGREKKVRDEIEGKILKGEADFADDEIVAQIRDDLDGTLGKRLDAIMNGTVGTRVSGEPRDTLTSVARDMVRKAIVKKGKKVSKENFAELVKGVLADPTERAKVQAEYDRRKSLDVDVELEGVA